MKILKVRLLNKNGQTVWSDFKVNEEAVTIAEVQLEEHLETTKILDLVKGKQQ